MILRNKLNSLTEDESAVLSHIVNISLPDGVEYRYDEFRLLRTSWLSTALKSAKTLIKPEHINIIESIEKKLL